MTQLEGRTALITGGGSGIGAAIARSFSDAGCRVIVTGRRLEVLQQVAESDPAGRITPVAADVVDRDSVAALFEQALAIASQIDILVNSAGINVPNRAMSDLTPEDWDRVLAINATGTFNCIREVLPGMRERRDGVIINITSVAGMRTGLLGGVAYNASKFAASALGRTVGEEERENGVRVTTIYPGEVETPILDDRPVPVSAEHRARILQPEDVAAATLMVAELPPRARVPELVITPTTQSFT